ncbi:ATP synthase F0 subunit B [bacterium]|nr:MAG: ATP synthase F0 subunit B [bacterium]
MTVDTRVRPWNRRRSMKLKSRTNVILASLAAMALPALALAQEGAKGVEHAAQEAGHAAGEHMPKAGVLPTIQEGIVPMIVSILVFVVVLAILSALVWPKIVAGLEERANKIKSEIKEAEMARAQSEDALKQYQKSLAEARAESQRMIETAKSQTLTIAADLRAKAEIELTQMREQAKRDIEAAKRAAVSELYQQAATLATDLAGKILKRNINANDQKALIEESLGQLASMKN